jgi:hypothetical protein
MTHRARTLQTVGAALALSILVAAPASAARWPAAARAEANAAAARWSANVLPTARLGAEQPGRCRQMDAAHAACPIAIVVLARDTAGRRPWRCSATVVVSRAGDRLTSRRTATRCAPFPRPAAVGDLACLPANDSRTTCVMTYVARTGERCRRAVSTPPGRPDRAVALYGPTCR